MIHLNIILLLTCCHLIFSSSVTPAKNTTSTIKETAKNNSGYIMTPGIGAHNYHKILVSWNEARKICISEGAHLAVINSALEESIISKYQADNRLNGMWLGIHSQFKKDDWVTVGDQQIDSLSYLHWCDGEPNSNGNERCVTHEPYVDRTGMSDLNCDQKRGFICEIDLNDCNFDFHIQHICPSFNEVNIASV